MAPAHQRLGPDALSAGQLEDRLVDELELLLLKRRVQIGLQLEAALQARVHARVE